MFEGTSPGGLRRLFARLTALALAFLFAVAARAQAPTITSLPAARQIVALGQNLTLNASASGATSFQWKRNGRAIAGATAGSYSILGASPPRDHGWYQIVATNASGSTASAAVFVNVYVPATQSLGWGFSQSLYPPALANVSAVALTEVHGMAVLADGALFRWGAGNQPESVPPAGLSGVVAVAGSWQHSLALKSDGTVVAWGLYQNEFSAGPGGPVAGLTDVVAISDAAVHSMALRRDGTVAVWASGTLPAELAAPAGLANVVSISAGAYYCLAAKADGTVVGWGNSGTAGTLVPAGLTGVVSVHAGTNSAAALKSDGTVVAWSRDTSTSYLPPADLAGVVALAAGDSHFFALKNDGRVVFWGSVMRWGPTMPSADFANVQFVASSQFNIVGIADSTGAVAPAISAQPASLAPGLGQTVTFTVAAAGTAPLTYQWQRRASGTAEFVEVPYQPAVFSGARTPTLTVTGTTAAMRGDEFRCLVSNGIGAPAVSAVALLNVTAAPVFTGVAQATFSVAQAGLFKVTATGAPAPTFAVGSGNFPSWATLDAATGLITGTPPSAGGSPFAFTIEARNTAGAPPTVQNFVLTVVVAPTFTSISAPQQSVISGRTLAIAGTATDATAYQWKRNGRPVAGATSSTLTLTGAVAFRDAGWYQLVATNAAGAARTSPVVFVNVIADPPILVRLGNFYGTTPPTDLPGVASVAGAGACTLALTGDGRVSAWGWGPFGQLDVPADLAEVVAISGGGSVCVALKSDGTLVAWGQATSPVFSIPADLNRVVQIAVGDNHAVALRDDGSVVGWGANYYGQSTPPETLRDAVAVAVGSYHSLALKADGTVVAWGENFSQQATVPAGLADVVALAAADRHSLALRADGTLVEWGSRSWSGSAPAPTPRVVGIATANSTNLALKADGTVVGWGSANFGELTIPAGTDRVVGFALTSSSVTLLRDGTVNLAPVITTSPATQTKDPGQTASFTVLASGTAPLVYRWQRQAAGTTEFADVVTSAVYGGVATATLTVNGTTEAMGGDQFRCIVSNGIGTPATSAAATLFVSAPPVFTSAPRATFILGRPCTFAVTVTGSPVPSVSISGDAVPPLLSFNALTRVISWRPGNTTGSPFVFTLTASNGVGAPVTQTFTLTVQPGHSADTSPADGTLNLAELTRVIELYNTRTGSVRTGRYTVFAGSVDGYAPDPSVTAGPIPTTPHTADLNRDGRLSLTELTRVIEIFNTRAGTTRTGAYHAAASPFATEDGFAPGP